MQLPSVTMPCSAATRQCLTAALPSRTQSWQLLLVGACCLPEANPSRFSAQSADCTAYNSGSHSLRPVI